MANDDKKPPVSVTADRRNCPMCMGFGNNLCDQHRKEVVGVTMHASRDVAATLDFSPSELVELCRAIGLAPLGVY